MHPSTLAGRSWGWCFKHSKPIHAACSTEIVQAGSARSSDLIALMKVLCLDARRLQAWCMLHSRLLFSPLLLHATVSMILKNLVWQCQNKYSILCRWLVLVAIHMRKIKKLTQVINKHTEVQLWTVCSCRSAQRLYDEAKHRSERQRLRREAAAQNMEVAMHSTTASCPEMRMLVGGASRNRQTAAFFRRQVGGKI